MAQSTVFREYTRDDSFVNLVIPENVREVQVCLTFARDYDGNDSTNGRFIPYWDTEKVTPEVIRKFKDRYKLAKVLITIGNNKKQFPFNIGGTSIDEWISKATGSLTAIVKGYHLNGIDVNYEDIESNQSDFAHCIGEVIKKLKQDGVITVASIAPNATNDSFYFPLYQGYVGFFDTVVFQCFNGFTPGGDNKVRSLKEKILSVANKYNPKQFLVGYSVIKGDWDNVPPALFFLAISDILSNPIIKGISIKVISDPIASFPPNWIPQLLSLAPTNADEP